MEHLVDRQVQTIVRTWVVIRILARLHQFSLGVFDLDGNRVDADHFLQVLAVLGVTFEPDGIAFDQELENHVLDEGGNTEPVGERYRLPLHVLVVAGDLDLVAHGEGAPGVDAVLHQGFFDVVLPRLAGALFPRRRDGLRGVYPAKNGGVQCRSRGQRNNHQIIDMRRGVRFAGGSSCRRVWL